MNSRRERIYSSATGLSGSGLLSDLRSAFGENRGYVLYRSTTDPQRFRRTRIEKNRGRGERSCGGIAAPLPRRLRKKHLLRCGASARSSTSHVRGLGVCLGAFVSGAAWRDPLTPLSQIEQHGRRASFSRCAVWVTCFSRSTRRRSTSFTRRVPFSAQ
jgi:hypothetical protein